MLNYKILVTKNKIKILKFFNILFYNFKFNNNLNFNNNLISNSLVNNNSNNILHSKNFKFFSNNNDYKVKFLNQREIKNFNNFFGAKELFNSNLLKINKTIFDLNNFKEFNHKNFVIPVNPLPIFYNNNLAPILNKYLKAITVYNIKNKGIIINYSKIIGFNFNSHNNKLIKNIYKFLAASFYSMYALISKPVFIFTPNKLIIQIFYYLLIPNLFKYKIRYRKRYSYLKKNFSNRIFNKNKFNIKHKYSNNYKYKKFKFNQRILFKKLASVSLINLFPNKFKILCLILSRLFKKPVELDLIRLHYPYNDSNILVNLLSIMINKIKIRIIFKKLFRKAIIKNPNKFSKNISSLPAFLSGMNIKIAGRLLTQKVIPRKTIKIIRKGALTKGKINFYDVARLTKKNKRGAFSITISSGQNFN